MSDCKVLFEVEMSSGHVVALHIGEEGAYILLTKDQESSCRLLPPEVSRRLESIS